MHFINIVLPSVSVRKLVPVVCFGGAVLTMQLPQHALSHSDSPPALPSVGNTAE